MADPLQSVSLAGKTVIVTGANAGIGKETALALAKRGPRLILACRNAEKGETARQEIVAASQNNDVIVKILNLSSLKSIKTFADEFNESEARLDILVNNAGVMTGERQVTEDGFEMDFGTNHIGHFYLTYLLLDKLKSSASSRVVIVSGDIYKLNGKLDFDDLNLTKKWDVLPAYSKSKTANILFGVHLAKLLKGTGVTTYSLHPGVIETGLGAEAKAANKSCLLSFFQYCCCCIYVTPAEGSKNTVYCSLSPAIANESGNYYMYLCAVDLIRFKCCF